MTEGAADGGRLAVDLIAVDGLAASADLGAVDAGGLVVVAQQAAGGPTWLGAAAGALAPRPEGHEAAWTVATRVADALAHRRLPATDQGEVEAAREAAAAAIDDTVEGLGLAGEEREQFASARPTFEKAVMRALADGAGSTAKVPAPERREALLTEVCRSATRFHRADGASGPAAGAAETPNVYDDLRYLQPLGVNGAKGHLLERQALAYGFDTVRFSKGAFVAARAGGPDLPFKWSRSPVSSAVSISLCNHKEATRLALRRSGLPTPKGRMFRRGEFDAAIGYAAEIGYPVVCKPAAGVRGIGVVAGIADEAGLRSAFEAYATSRLGADDFIVEQHIDGGDYRIVVVGDRVEAAILRRPASVVGDGERTVAELVLEKNETRRHNPHLWGRLIPLHAGTDRRLAEQGLDLASVPAEGREVCLSDTSSLSQGGDSIDVLDELHPSIAEAAVAATKTVPGLGYCGVDFLLADHRLPVGEQTAAGICELNAHAAIGNGEYPMFGRPRAVAESLFRRSADAAGYALDEPLEIISLRLEVRGRVTGVGYRAWYARHAARFGVAGWVENAERRRVRARLEGPVPAVAALASLAIAGSPAALPTSVHAAQAEVEGVTGFEVRR